MKRQHTWLWTHEQRNTEWAVCALFFSSLRSLLEPTQSAAVILAKGKKEDPSGYRLRRSPLTRMRLPPLAPRGTPTGCIAPGTHCSNKGSATTRWTAFATNQPWSSAGKARISMDHRLLVTMSLRPWAHMW